MKKTGLAFVLLAVSVAVLSALDITGDFFIVTTSANGTPEQKAPVVLQEYLGKIFGKDVAVIPENQWKKGSPAIVLRPEPSLDQEEWKISAEGNVLTISGGWPRGLYYGVCEFLDKFGGVRWFTSLEEKVPRKDVISFPDGEILQRKPAFPLLRTVSTTFEDRAYQRSRSYLKENKVSPYGEWPTLFESRGLGNCHTYWQLTKAVPEGMERILPKDSSGNPVRAVGNIGPGQICFSDPEFRAFAKSEVAKWIEREEKFVEEKGLKGVWFRWIDLSQNDNGSFCQCEGCKELVKKYGTLAGAQLEFVNDIAAAFPDRLFQTFAYALTQDPPKNIRARENVMIQFAFLGESDLLRPISHANNAKIRAQYEGWKALADRKSVWAYHRLYIMSDAFPWPQCCYWNIAENIRFYREFGAVKLMIESEYAYHDLITPRAFHDLHNYLECKLMDDPDQDDEPLIEEFFQFQYGPAAEEMKAYASYLKKRIDAVPGIVSEKPIKARGIMDAEFFTIVNALLDRAESKAGNDPGLLMRIAMERIPVDYAAAEMWKQGGSASGIPYVELVDRLEKNIRAAYERYYPDKTRVKNGKTAEQRLQNELQLLRLFREPLPVPEEFEKEDVVQVSMLNIGGYEKYNVQDPDAAYGQAQKVGSLLGTPDEQCDHTKWPMLFGLYDHTLKKSVLYREIKQEEIPSDEKYHLYYLGRHAPNGFHKEQLYGHRTWGLRLQYAYKPLWNPVDQGREWDIYISCKMTGPAYVKGSTSENAVYVDKILAVKRGIRSEVPAEEKAAK